MKPQIIFEVLTLFPNLFKGFLDEGLLGKAVEKGLIEVNLHNFRKHGIGPHLKVDDEPYGGGPGMLLRVEPVVAAIEERKQHFTEQGLQNHVILLSPEGHKFDQEKADELARAGRVLTLVCGRYEGFDRRIYHWADEIISGGDFVSLGGETIAMTIIEATSRLIDGVIGNKTSLQEESCSGTLLAEYPQYTRPPSFRGQSVPEVLLSGNHQLIKEWRTTQSELINPK